MNEPTDFNEAAGTFLRVDVGDGWFSIMPQEESVIRRAVRDFRERRVDSLLEIEDRYGCTINLVASTVLSFRLSTPETRRSAILEEIRQDEWEERFRKENAAKPWDASP